jgi:hypothetical protein
MQLWIRSLSTGLLALLLVNAGNTQQGSDPIYRDSQRRFTVQVPAGWTAKAVGDNVELSYRDVSVNVMVLEGNGTAPELVEFLAGQIGQQWKNFERVSSADSRLGGRPGASAIYSGVTPNRIEALGRVVAATTGGKGYALVMSVPKDQFTSLKSALDEIENSFSLEGNQISGAWGGGGWAAAPVPAHAAPPLSLTLRDVRKIFIAAMANDMDQYIRAEITKQLSGRLTVVLVEEEADAVLSGVGEWQKGTKATVTGRWLGLHDTATGAVSLTTRDGVTVLWSGEAGDRSLWFGAMKRGGPRKVADRLVHELKKTLEGASR